MFLARLLSRKTYHCTVKFYQMRRCYRTKSKIFSITNQFDLDCPEVNEMRYKLKNKLSIPNEKANLILLKWINDQQIEKNRINLDEKINLFLQHLKQEDINHNLHIFSMDIDKFRDGMFVLNELGFDNIEVKLLDNISVLMNKSVEDLKLNGLYPNINIVDYICNYLKKHFHLSIKNNFTEELKNIDDSLTLKQIRQTFQSQIIKLFLNCSDQVSLKLKIHLRFKFSTFRSFYL